MTAQSSSRATARHWTSREKALRIRSPQNAKTVERVGWNARTLHLYSRAGTHMDAQTHFAPGAGTIDQTLLERCTGPAWVVNLDGCRRGFGIGLTMTNRRQGCRHFLNMKHQGLDHLAIAVAGQLWPGIPVWRLGAEARFPELNYVVFPGNVGAPDALAEAVSKLNV